MIPRTKRRAVEYGRIIYAHKRTAYRLRDMTAAALTPSLRDAGEAAGKVSLAGGNLNDVNAAIQQFSPRFVRALEVPLKRIVTGGVQFEHEWITGNAPPEDVVAQTLNSRQRRGMQVDQSWLPDLDLDLSLVLMSNVLSWLSLRAFRAWQRASNALYYRLFRLTGIPGEKDIVSKMRNVDGLARRLAMLETTGGLNFGAQQLRIDKGIGYKIWLSIIDDRTRVGQFDHIEPNRQIRTLYDPFIVSREPLMYPGDDTLGASDGNLFNCFLPGTVIEGRVSAAAKSVYRGQAVEIEYGSGGKLRVTYNHPVLTEHGFVPAGLLQEGDKLFHCERDIDDAANAGRRFVSAGLEPNEEYQPTRIEQIFQSLVAVGSTHHRRREPGDFHGDGHFLDGDIDVVSPDWELLAALEACGGDRFGERSLELADQTLIHESPGRAAAPFGFGRRTTLPGFPRGGTLPPHLSGILLDGGPFECFRFGSASRFDASLAEHAVDGSSGYAERLGQTKDGRSLAVQFQQACRSGAIVREAIAIVRHFEYSGEVFDVQSPQGWIMADGTVCSNCRCFALSMV